MRRILFVYLFICVQDNSKISGQLRTKFSESNNFQSRINALDLSTPPSGKGTIADNLQYRLTWNQQI